MTRLAATVFFLFAIFSATELQAWVIILNDRTTYYGQVEPAQDGGYVITDSNGKKTTITKKDIMRIIDDDANSTWFNQPKLPRQWKKETKGLAAKTWLGLEASENGLSGLGFIFEHSLGGGFSPVVAGGAAPWGTRLGFGLRYYPSDEPVFSNFTPALSVGGSYTFGRPFSVQANGSSATTFVSSNDVGMVHFSGLTFFDFRDRAVRMYIEAGYAVPIGGEARYSVTSGRLTTENRKLLEAWQPGGILFSLSFALAF